MNNDNNFIKRDDGIGTDPTVMNVIDTLDVEPNLHAQAKQTKTPKDPNKKGNLGKTILLTLVVLSLIAGVAYGLFYYLRVGNKKGGNTSSKTNMLSPVKLNVGEELSSDVLSYGDFSNVDIATCNMDSSKVDNTKAGTYDLTITCGNEKYHTKVVVKERVNFETEGKISYKATGASYDIYDFITVPDGYEAEFKNEDALSMSLNSKGGPFPVEITVKNQDNETTVYTALYVYSQLPRMSLECSKDKVTDRISFDTNYENMNDSLRIYTYTFADESEYYKTVSQISNSRLTIEGRNGVPVTNDKNKEIKIISELSKDILSSEYKSDFPKEYSKINNYYRNTKNYTCSNLT